MCLCLLHFSLHNNLSTARTCRSYSWCCGSQCHQGKLKFFEGVHKLLLPPETSPKACSDYYPWFLKRPSNKTSRYIHQQWILFFSLQILRCVYQGHITEHQVPAMFHNLNANPQVQKEDVTDAELYCWIRDFVLRGLNPLLTRLWPVEPPCHTDTYHTIFGLKFRYNYAYYRCKVPPTLKD